MEILNIALAVALIAFAVRVVMIKIEDDRDHRRYMDQLRRTQQRSERDAANN
jgi:hypothetical protein